MWNECQKPEIRAHRATDWSETQQKRGWWSVRWRLDTDAGGFRRGVNVDLEEQRQAEGLRWRCRRFNYWAVALLLSPHPRILTTTPLLLHSRKEQTKHNEEFWKKNRTRESERGAYFFKAHGTEFVYFACVFRTGNRSASVDVRPEPRRLFEHLWVLLVLWKTQQQNKSHSRFSPGFQGT